ncbi:MAG: Rieske (2Fe-2S) protein [Steroidobacteraceae bacterium]
MTEIDLSRVLCALGEIPVEGARGFVFGGGDWPLRGLLVRTRDGVRAYLNRCPHAGHGLDLLPNEFLTPDGRLILCRSHGALFEKSTGACVTGPCAGRGLTAIPVRVEAGYVLLEDGVDATSFEHVEAV